MKIELDLTKDELQILMYLISSADSPHARDPLKDTYELGKDEPEDPYGALRTMADKFYEANRALGEATT